LPSTTTLNVISAAYATGVQKLLFLRSSCIYPKFAPQAMDQQMLLTGPLEPDHDRGYQTDRSLSSAVRRGLHLDNANHPLRARQLSSEHSHVPPALIPSITLPRKRKYKCMKPTDPPAAFRHQR
jgi:hypothetical protein